MSTLNTQYGKSATGDFEENTWTFDMPESFRISAGKFAIVPADKFARLLTAIKGIRNSMNVHPDCEPDSEFSDMVSRCDEILAEI